MKNEVEQIALQNDMSIEFVTWFFNEKKAGCGNVWFMMMAAMWEGWKGRSIEMDKLAAENVALKETRNNLAEFIHEELDADYPLNMNLETHATDRIVAVIKADGVEEFIGLLQQHVDEGDFVGDEVAVIVGAIDCGKEFCEQLRDGGSHD
ncbi:hypothetical protein [Klebsiella quasipneumoniae]|uniref:hypothetical protein n=1 Tax=Klebsiella quasipneumoniae TaxID=1463165 RepID=UPI00388F1A38|nr:hypothetical protein [Klebsiella quasipneumoniae]